MIKTLGHVFLGSMFIYGGSNALLHPEYIVPKVESAGLSQPRQATILNGAVMTVAGTALAAGLLPKLAATLLIGALLPTTYIGHAFWKADSANRAGEQIHFLKNLAMIGGLLMVLVEKND